MELVLAYWSRHWPPEPQVTAPAKWSRHLIASSFTLEQAQGRIRDRRLNPQPRYEVHFTSSSASCFPHFPQTHLSAETSCLEARRDDFLAATSFGSSRRTGSISAASSNAASKRYGLSARWLEAAKRFTLLRSNSTKTLTPPA